MGPDQYELRIRGRLGAALLDSFDGFDAEVEPLETVLRGEVADQSGLLGILEQVREAGLEVIDVWTLNSRRQR
jgi:hypothetical protein